MTGKPRALCAIVPEAVWAMARIDYEQGMSAKAVCARYGMREPGLRGRAHREGWRKSGVGGLAAEAVRVEAVAPPAAPVSPAPIHPLDVARGALARASEALMAGRPAEAVAIVRALDDVLPIAEAFGVDHEVHDLEVTVQAAAAMLAERILGDGEVSERHAAFAFRWRAEHLGEAAAAQDRHYAERMGWTPRLYDEAGRLRVEAES
jgi:hypothetical protein